MVSYTQLEPTSFQALGVQKTPGFDSTNLSFFATSSFVYLLLGTAIIGAAFYEYVLVGVYRMEASESGIRKSNETFKRTTLGLLGVFSLFLIIFTLNKSLLTGDVDLGGFKASPAPAVAQTQTTTQTTPTTNTTTNSNYAARLASHNQIATRFSASNIKTNYNNTPCTEAQFNETKPSCTSLAFMKEETVQLILKLKTLCNCVVVVTGGTEPGHLSHGENKRPVDLRLTGTRGSTNNTDPLYVFIKNTASNKLGGNSTCYERYTLYSFTFCDEKPPNTQHFHVY